MQPLILTDALASALLTILQSNKEDIQGALSFDANDHDLLQELADTNDLLAALTAVL